MAQGTNTGSSGNSRRPGRPRKTAATGKPGQPGTRRQSSGKASPRPRKRTVRATSNKKGGGRHAKGFSFPWRFALVSGLLFLSLAALVYLVFLYQPDKTEAPEPTLPTMIEDPAPQLIEPQEEKKKPADKPDEKPPTPPKSPEKDPEPIGLIPIPEYHPDDQRPLLAIVIDDMGGYAPEVEMELLRLRLPYTFSFLPFSPKLDKFINIAGQQGRDIILHLPMEALDEKWSDTPGMLLRKMSEQELISGFAEALHQMPMVKGFNNHMGSRLTADPKAMDTVMAQAAHYQLYFLDSFTSHKSVATEWAKKHQVPFLKRDIFLDNVQEEAAIKEQLEKLLQVAEKKGQAIGIAHPYPATLSALKAFAPQLEKRVRMVPLSYFFTTD